MASEVMLGLPTGRPDVVGIAVFAVFLVLALVLRGIHAQQLLNLGVAAIAEVPLFFAVAFMLRKIPLVSSIL